MQAQIAPRLVLTGRNSLFISLPVDLGKLTIQDLTPFPAMFCQCYFNPEPAAHSSHGSHGAVGQHFCRFNRAFRVNNGSFGSAELTGVKFWMAGDLGGDFSKDHVDWAVLTFEPSTTKEQCTAIATILHHVYPFTWNSFTVATDAAMEWNATGDQAEARLDGGKTAEVVLHKAQGMTDEPITIKNLKYDGAPRNEGFTFTDKQGSGLELSLSPPRNGEERLSEMAMVKRKATI